jgi:tRNA G18 (ribose-2'-O)-methylase SpoU
MAVVLGSEASGLSRQMEKNITDWVHIPMAGDVDSLNVSVAGALVLFEIARQHRLLEHDFRDVL